MSSKAKIASLLGTAPTDLVDYFDAGHFRVLPNSSISCLALDEAADYSADLLHVGLGIHLGLFVLSDDGDSNPYCYISRGPCAGAVMQLSHDGESAIRFSSLSLFLEYLDAPRHEEDIQDNQVLGAGITYDVVPAITDLLNKEDEHMDILIPVYLPVAEALPPDLKTGLATCIDFYVRETFANWLRDRGGLEDLSLARSLASDPMAQVAQPAKQAVVRLGRL